MTLRMEVAAPPERIPEGPVVFLPFTARKEGSAYILGSDLSRKYLEVGIEGMRAIELMQAGVAWQDVAGRLREETGRDFDVPPFLRKLAQHGFVARVGPFQVWDGTPPKPEPPASPHWRLVRSPWMLPLVAPALAGLALLWTWRDDVLHPRMLAFTPDPLLSILTFLAIAWALVLVHEAGHYAMARSFGIPATIRLSTRLQTLVAETDITRAWSLSKGKRAAILLAGPAVNVLMLGYVELAIRMLYPGSHGPTVLRMTLLANVLQLFFQTLVFLRTDGYYLLAALGPERNLRTRAFRALRATFARGRLCPHCAGFEASPGACALCSTGRPASPTRRWALAGFGAFTVGMSAAFLALGLFLLGASTLPFLGHLAGLVAESRATGDWRSGGQALALMAVIVAQLGLVLFFTARNGVRWARGRRAAKAQTF